MTGARVAIVSFSPTAFNLSCTGPRTQSRPSHAVRDEVLMPNPAIRASLEFSVLTAVVEVVVDL